MFPLRSPTAFEDVISGRRGGWSAALVRGCLRLAEVPYTWAVEYRNRRYDRGQSRRSCGSPVPVISVGNITAGGTGKTPLVAWLAEWLAGARAQSRADQPWLQSPGAAAE